MLFVKGVKPWNKGTKGIMKSNVTSFKKGLTPWNKGKKGMIPWNKGKKCPKISASKMGHKVTPEQIAKFRLSRTGKSMKHDKQFKKGQPSWNKGKHTGYLTHTPENVKKMLRRRDMSSLEIKFDNLVKELGLPYRFVGNGEVTIGRKCPDFVNTNGKKIAIEVFYSKHKDNFANGLESWKSNRQIIFNEYGWDILFFNETQVTRENLTKRLSLGGD